MTPCGRPWASMEYRGRSFSNHVMSLLSAMSWAFVKTAATVTKTFCESSWTSMECQANLRESFHEHSWTFMIYVERSRHAVKHCMERFSANFMVHIAEAQNGVRVTAENAADRAKGHRGTVRRQAVLYVTLCFYFLRAPKPERRSGHHDGSCCL